MQSKFSKQELYDLENEDVALFHSVIEEKKYQLAEHAFSELGKRCQQLLHLFYHKAMSFKTIAEVMQFSSDKVAKNQKYKCLVKAKDIYNQVLKTIQS